jgi:hypothetical protein
MERTDTLGAALSRCLSRLQPGRQPRIGWLSQLVTDGAVAPVEKRPMTVVGWTVAEGDHRSSAFRCALCFQLVLEFGARAGSGTQGSRFPLGRSAYAGVRLGS